MAKKKLFGLKQIRQLEEIQKARLKKEGIGIHDEIQELIQRLTAGGVGAPKAEGDPFLTQSKVLWDKGWGWELSFKKLDDYRKSLEAEGLVVAPERPPGMPDHLNRLILWDRRPLLVKQDGGERVSLVKACRLCGVAYGGDDATLIQHEATPEITVPVRWVWCQDGRMHRNRKPSDCRQSFVAPEVGAEALIGLFLYAQDCAVIGRKGPERYVVDLPGSVGRGSPSSCAYLVVWVVGPRLDWCWDGFAFPGYGSASRWE